jgi:predicted DsbA family dithiol-disulfide isomerase
MNKPLVIEYFTDVLCVWAWIAQRRIDELIAQFGEAIELQYHYVDVFGDTAGKMQSQWADRGLYEGFSVHVVDSATPFEDAPTNPRIWSEVRPATSANAHLVLKATEISYGEKASVDLALALRRSFFIEAKDIGDFPVLFDLLEPEGLSKEAISRTLNDGTAIAALMGDYQKARTQMIKGSPSYVLDNGRQTLYGNVGYRVLQANIEELLKRPESEASWC